MNAPPKDSSPPPLDDVAARVANLIERGLRRYGRGDLDGALGEWELALALDPDAKAAEDYIAYVRENFTQLSESFRAEQELAALVRAEGIPIPEDDANEEEFPEIEVTSPGEPDESEAALEATQLAPAAPEAPAANGPSPASAEGPRLSHEISSVDEGWEIDAESAATQAAPAPPGLREGAAPGMPIVTVVPRRHSEVPLEEALLAGGATTDDFEYSEIPELRRSAPPPVEPATPLEADPAGETTPDPAFSGDDEFELATESRPRLGGASDFEKTAAMSPGQLDELLAAPADEQGDPLAFEDEFSSQSTAALTPAGAGRALADERFPESDRATPTPGGPPPPLDESMLAAYDDVVEFVQPGTGRRPRPDTIQEPSPPPPSATSRPEKLAALFEEIRAAVAGGDFGGAVQAAERLVEADPELAFFDAREREILMRVYEASLGRMDQVPLVAVPMQEISAANLDHRTGFLLSRIDGMLTYEDILDVAGMPRLEAYRILTHLLRRGFIDVR